MKKENKYITRKNEIRNTLNNSKAFERFIEAIKPVATMLEFFPESFFETIGLEWNNPENCNEFIFKIPVVLGHNVTVNHPGVSETEFIDCVNRLLCEHNNTLRGQDIWIPNFVFNRIYSKFSQVPESIHWFKRRPAVEIQYVVFRRNVLECYDWEYFAKAEENREG